MPIQWFPGHMAAARKKAGETLAAADVVIEVVDARIPEASTNPMIHQLRRHRQRPCLKILNKAGCTDINLVELPRAMTKLEALQYLTEQGITEGDAGYAVANKLAIDFCPAGPGILQPGLQFADLPLL